VAAAANLHHATGHDHNPSFAAWYLTDGKRHNRGHSALLLRQVRDVGY
jgi:hypothetical protein